MFEFIKKALSGSNEAEIKRLRKTVEQIGALEGQMQKLSDEEMRAYTGKLRERAKGGEDLDKLLPEAYALVREAAVRALGQRPFDTQMIGAIVLHQGRIAEMRTGEGKTLTAALPAFLNALPGEGVHIVTVNEYLARFHSEWMGKVYRFLGLTVGLIEHDMDAPARQAAYACDITYGTNNEFGFDYLRDNMVTYKANMVQRGHAYAIVDEVDSILIDEARTPLIISGRGEDSSSLYTQVDQFVRTLRKSVVVELESKEEADDQADGDYVVDEKHKTATLTASGIKKAEEYFKVENLAAAENMTLVHHIEQAIKAHGVMKKDIDYVVKDGEVIIVDEFTGRLMIGRRYNEGLHQAIEAKEGVHIASESKTLATITFQNYFRMYKKLAGMTGTARTEATEFTEIYGLNIVTVPTNKPNIRKDYPDVVYSTVAGKYRAVIEQVMECHAKGQPVLVGTVSVEKSEILAKMLQKRTKDFNVLNAKNHEREAEIVAQAGKKGAITIATNMAGRGTDIMLGGNAEFMAKAQMRKEQFCEKLLNPEAPQDALPEQVEALLIEADGHGDTTDANILAARARFDELYRQYKDEIAEEAEEVRAAGGLFIIGTERHESRRIDNQLRGRAGRQGDPGSSQFFISFEDDLMRLFGSDRFRPMLERLAKGGEEAIEFGLVSKQIENAQKRVESRNYDIRRHVLQYDDVMNQQRNIIYGQRREVLEGGDMRARIQTMRKTLITEAVGRHAPDEAAAEHWDIAGLSEYLEHLCIDKGGVQKVFDELPKKDKKSFVEALDARAQRIYELREKMWEDNKLDMREFERVALLGAVDRRWMDHIDAMTELRDGIGLRALAQRDPVVEYKLEGFEMFDEMVRMIQEDTMKRLYFTVITPRQPLERKQVATPVTASHGEPTAKRPVRADKKVGRNDPCPCGSGKKYKNCCGANT